MKTALAAAVFVACLSAISATTAEAHVKHVMRHHRAWCATHYCKPPRHIVYQHNRLDGTEPLCGFNDGTYLRNALECPWR